VTLAKSLKKKGPASRYILKERRLISAGNKVNAPKVAEIKKRACVNVKARKMTRLGGAGGGLEGGWRREVEEGVRERGRV
jgi:hypothetical protein